MPTAKNNIASALFLLISISNVYGQNSADEYLRLADDFKKNLKPDSAIRYYEKAAAGFRALGNHEKFVYACTQTGLS